MLLLLFIKKMVAHIYRHADWYILYLLLIHLFLRKRFSIFSWLPFCLFCLLSEMFTLFQNTGNFIIFFIQMFEQKVYTKYKIGKNFKFWSCTVTVQYWREIKVQLACLLYVQSSAFFLSICRADDESVLHLFSTVFQSWWLQCTASLYAYSICRADAKV